MNKTIKAFTLGLTGSILALGVSMAAPQKAEARVTVCHFGPAGQILTEDLCDVNRRVNANGHVVFDIKQVSTNRHVGTVVLWDDDTAEWIRNGKVIRNILTEDLPNGYIRLVDANDFNFIFQAR